MRYLLGLFIVIVITACHSGNVKNSLRNISTANPNAISSSAIFIDSSTQIPVFTQPTHTYTFVHNESSKAINGITYFLIGNSGFKLDNPNECQTIAANQKCKLWFTTPAAQPGENGSVFIKAIYNIDRNQQQAFASNILTYSYVNPAEYTGVAYLNELYATGHYGLAYFFVGNISAQAIVKPTNPTISVLDETNQISVNARQVYPVEVSIEAGANGGLQVMPQTTNKTLKSDVTPILNVQSVSPNTRGAYLVMSEGNPMNALLLESSTITIMNLGNESTTSISIPTPAGLNSTTTCPNILNPGNTCTVKLQTTGQAPGNGTLTINYNYNGGSRSAIQNIYWYNRKDYPYIAASYSAATKAITLNSSLTTVVTLTNIGGYKLTSLTESGSPSSNGTVSINTTGNVNPCGSTLDINASCSFSVQIIGTSATANAVKAIFTISGNYQGTSGQQSYSLKQAIPYTVAGNYYIAVGAAPTVVSTTNGSSVNPIMVSGATTDPQNIYFLNNYFYSVAGGGIVMRSTDGINFQPLVKINAGNLLNGQFPQQMAGDGNNTLILVGSDGASSSVLCSSNNGTTWNKVQSISAGIFAAAYGNGKFVVAGINGQMWGGTDCNSGNWAQITGISITDTINSGTYANGYFVFVANNGKIIYSQTGNNNSWTVYTGLSFLNFLSVVYANNKFTVMALNNSNNTTWFMNSTGSTPDSWNAPYSAYPFVLPRPQLAFGNGYYVAMSDISVPTIYYSSSANGPWTLVESTNIPRRARTGFGARGMAFGNNKFVFAATNGIGYSTNFPPTSWSMANTFMGLNAVVKYDSNNAYAVGQNGVGYNINFGTNPVTLTQLNASDIHNLVSVAAEGPNKLAALQTNGYIVWTTNPQSAALWTVYTNPVPGIWFSMASASTGPANKWVMVGAGCATAYAADFSIVQNGTWNASYSCPSGVVNGTHFYKVRWFPTISQYVAVGSNGTLLASFDGSNWSKRAGTFTGSPILKDIAFCDANNVVVVGTNNSETAGVIYTGANLEVPFTQRATAIPGGLPTMTSVSCSGTNVVATGSDGRVFFSSDLGATWDIGVLNYSTAVPVPLTDIFFK